MVTKFSHFTEKETKEDVERIREITDTAKELEKEILSLNNKIPSDPDDKNIQEVKEKLDQAKSIIKGIPRLYGSAVRSRARKK